MKKFILPVICILLTFSLSGCGLMEDAFKAGFIIALIIAAVIGLLMDIPYELEIAGQILPVYPYVF